MRDFTSTEAEGGEEEPQATLPAIKFTLDGEEFRCRTEFDADALLEWSEMAVGATDDVAADSPEAAAYFARFLRASFGTQEYRRLRAHIKAHKTGPRTLMAIIAGIQEEMSETVQGMTGRPTEAPSSSSPGDEGRAGQVARLVSLGTGEVSFVDPPGGRAAPQDHKRKGGKPRQARPAASAG